MSADLWGALHRELDLWSRDGRVVRLWLRDDDAVAPSAALDRLVGVAERFAAPVLLAVIPFLARPELAGVLARAPLLVPCQHGAWHANHAPAGEKKAEFGRHRPAEVLSDELRLARERLGELLADEPPSVFVPPWNRIDPGFAPLLADLGFSGLSCFRGFDPAPALGPAVVNSDVDVMNWRGGRVGRDHAGLVAETVALLAARRRLAQGGDTTLGLLLHHRDHDEIAWSFVVALLAELAGHDAVRLADPRGLFDDRGSK